MIEEVEKLGPELDPNPLMDLRIFDERQISVVESRADDHVPAEITKARYSSEDRSIEPAVSAPYNFDRSGYVGTKRAG